MKVIVSSVVQDTRPILRPTAGSGFEELLAEPGLERETAPELQDAVGGGGRLAFAASDPTISSVEVADSIFSTARSADSSVLEKGLESPLIEPAAPAARHLLSASDQAVGFDALGVFGRGAASKKTTTVASFRPEEASSSVAPVHLKPSTIGELFEAGLSVGEAGASGVLPHSGDEGHANSLPRRLPEDGRRAVHGRSPDPISPSPDSATSARPAAGVDRSEQVGDLVPEMQRSGADRSANRALVERGAAASALRLEISGQSGALAVSVQASGLSEADRQALRRRAEAVAAAHGLALGTLRINGQGPDGPEALERNLTWR